MCSRVRIYMHQRRTVSTTAKVWVVWILKLERLEVQSFPTRQWCLCEIPRGGTSTRAGELRKCFSPGQPVETKVANSLVI